MRHHYDTLKIIEQFFSIKCEISGNDQMLCEKRSTKNLKSKLYSYNFEKIMKDGK